MPMRLKKAIVALAIVLAGCGGGGGGGPVIVSADAATIQPGTLESTEFEPGAQSTNWVNSTVSVSISGDVELQASKDVRAQAPVRTYQRDTDAGPILIGLFTVPAVHLLESSADIVRNPAEGLAPVDLVGRVQSTYSDIDIAQQTANTSVVILGNETHLVSYAGTATVDEQTREVRISIATIRHGGAFVTFIEISPAPEADPDRTQQLLAGVQH